MADPNTIRILSLDGGGERGYMSNYFLQRFVQLWGVNPASLAQQFDVICGTSVGGIMALYLSLGYTTEQIAPFFTEIGPYVFSTNSSYNTRPTTIEKVADLVLGTTFYGQPTGTPYGSALLVSTLQEEFGSLTMQDLQTNVIIPSYDYTTSSYVLFCNLNYPQFIGQTGLLSDAALATSAAPVYFPVWTIGADEYIDGGVYQNNPAQFGRTVGEMVKKTSNRCCLLSIGTGLGLIGFEPPPPVPYTPSPIELLFDLFSIASVGGQESVAQNMLLESSYTLEQFYYYRFQPDLDPTMDTELDNCSPEILAYYTSVVDDWMSNNAAAIADFIGHLTA